MYSRRKLNSIRVASVKVLAVLNSPLLNNASIQVQIKAITCIALSLWKLRVYKRAFKSNNFTLNCLFLFLLNFAEILVCYCY